jgi:hypothetical protein
MTNLSKTIRTQIFEWLDKKNTLVNILKIIQDMKKLLTKIKHF